MPKGAISDTKRRENYGKGFGPDFLTTDWLVLTGELRQRAVNYEERYFVQQHI